MKNKARMNSNEHYYNLRLRVFNCRLSEKPRDMFILYRMHFVLIFALCVFSFSKLASQTAQDSKNGKTSSTCQWVGNVEATVYQLGRIETVVGTVKYELDYVMGGADVYKLVWGNLTWNVSGTYLGECTFQGGPYNFDISDHSPGTGDLTIYHDGNYYGSVGFNDLAMHSPPLVKMICEDFTYETPSLSGQLVTGILDSTIIENDIMVGSQTQLTPPIYGAIYKWNLHKEGACATKLVVDAEGYKDWRPEAAASGEEIDVGNKLKFTASLTQGDGTPSVATADSFKFELTKVSHEPGVCLNYPGVYQPAETDFDLHFKHELNSPDDVMSPDRLTLRTKGGKEAAATVASFDWGAFGTLVVTAYLPGGKIIKGELKGHPEIKEILIPKRSPYSKIADIWKKGDVQWMEDGDDSETDPVGDGHPGDGFTLYEEYRGFFEDMKHICADPKKKDLFIFLMDGPEFLPGVILFKKLTGLDVHYKLWGGEFDKNKRVMNFNHADPALHRVDQHGLWIKPIPSSRDNGYSFVSPLGRIGPPKNIESVNISPGAYTITSIVREGGMEFFKELNSTVAHELGHAVCIKHHGETDKKRMWTTQIAFNLKTGQFDYEFFEAGHSGQVTLKWEDGTPFKESVEGEVWVAEWGGEHSGFEDCIMRYDYAFAYPGEGNIRYFVEGDERTGMKLCETKADSPDGVNYLSRLPRSRYGNATEGNCIHQICVNDKYH